MSEALNSQNVSGPTEIDQNDLHAVHFSSLEEMQAASEADGWSARYRQLQAGGLQARSVQGQCDSISLLDEYASRRIEVAGDTPEEHVTVMAPSPTTAVWTNGKSFGGEGIYIFDSRSECQVITSAGRIVSMHIPLSLLQETGRDSFDTWGLLIGNYGRLIECGAPAAQRLRSMMSAAIYQPEADGWQVQRASDLVTALATIINQNSGTQAQKKRSSAAESWRTIKRAREFVEGHLTEPIQINEVCAHSATSVSKLERTFRRELRMSPSQYVLASRLDAAYRELRGANSNRLQVAGVAMKYGFNHLGRFAGVYRAYFGELPSETLRSSE